jgi:hypothetical protein
MRGFVRGEDIIFLGTDSSSSLLRTRTDQGFKILHDVQKRHQKSFPTCGRTKSIRGVQLDTGKNRVEVIADLSNPMFLSLHTL